MGNRAVVTTEDNFNNNGLGMYLHWNGGRDSIEPLLLYAKLRDIETPNSSYFWARFAQIVGNALGGTMSLGVDTVNHLDCDNFDNGVYIIDNNFEIVDRKYFKGQEQNEYDIVEMLEEIDKSQPEGSRLENSLKEWSGDYAELIPDSLKKKVEDTSFSSITILSVTKTDDEIPYEVKVRLKDDSIDSKYSFNFYSLEEVNFYKNFADNGFDMVFCSNGVYKDMLFENIYSILTDPKKNFKVDNSENRENYNDFLPALWSSDNIVIYEQENITFPAMCSEEEFDRFKKFIENKEFLKENDIAINNEPKKVR